MAKLIFDPFHNVQEFTLILAHRDLSFYGPLRNVSDIRYTCNMNSADEMSFVLHKYADNIEEEFWDDVVDLRLVFVDELKEYYQIAVSMDDTSIDITKTVTCTSLCEAELSQYQINGLYINDTDYIAEWSEIHPNDKWNPVRFYDIQNAETSLLHKIFNNYAPTYTIGYVDDSLKQLERSFSIDGQSVYDFLTGDCAEQFNCIFKFDSRTRTVNVYDLYSVCNNPYCTWKTQIDYSECTNPNCTYYLTNKRHYVSNADMEECPWCHSTRLSGFIHQVPHNVAFRGEFQDKCPKCGSTDIQCYGEDTNVLVDVDNLTDSIQFTTDSDSIKNTFRIIGGDDDINAGILNVNPNGSNKIYYFSEEQKNDMPEGLVQRWNTYQAKVESKRELFRKAVLEFQNALDQIMHFEHSMMPLRQDDSTNAQEQFEAIQYGFQQNKPSMQKFSNKTGEGSVTLTIKNYAKVFVRTGYYKIEVDNVSYSYPNWEGDFTITNYSDKEDTYTGTISTYLISDYASYIQQRIDLIKRQEDQRKDNAENNIFDVLSIKSLEGFKNAITYYSLVRLESFQAALLSIQDTLNALGISNATEELQDDGSYQYVFDTFNGEALYNEFYLPICDKLDAINDEIDKRQETISQWETIRDNAENQMSAIRKELDIETNLGKEYCDILANYTREQDYSNDNFISDGMSNAEIYDRARMLVEQAEIDIVKSSEYQHSISATLNDLLVVEDFLPVLDSFDVGNFIRVRTDDQLYRLRIVSYEIDFENIEQISVEFSDMTKTALGMNDVGSILAAANSMAGSYNYVKKQSKRGDEAEKIISGFRQYGLDSAINKIQSNDREEVVMDANGITLRQWDDASNAYDPKQIRMTHNIVAFTKDGWRHTSMAMGNFDYVDEHGSPQEGYGVNADFVVAGYIEGSTMVAGQIYSAYDRTNPYNQIKIDLDKGRFSVGYSNGGASSWFDGNGDFSLGKGSIKYSDDTLTFGKDVVIKWENVDTGNNEFVTTDYLNNNYTSKSDLEGMLEAFEVSDELAGDFEQYLKENGYINDDGNIIYGNISGTPDLSAFLTGNSSISFDQIKDNLPEYLQDKDKFDKAVKDYIDLNYVNAVDNATAPLRTIMQNVLNEGGSLTTNDTIIKPKIGGGYLYITGDNGSVEINPRNTIYNGRNVNYPIFNVRDSSGNVKIGMDNNGDAVFTGTVYANNGTFTGTINSSDGKIGGWSIDSDSIYRNEISYNSRMYLGKDGLKINNNDAFAKIDRFGKIVTNNQIYAVDISVNLDSQYYDESTYTTIIEGGSVEILNGSPSERFTCDQFSIGYDGFGFIVNGNNYTCTYEPWNYYMYNRTVENDYEPKSSVYGYHFYTHVHSTNSIHSDTNLYANKNVYATNLYCRGGIDTKGNIRFNPEKGVVFYENNSTSSDTHFMLRLHGSNVNVGAQSHRLSLESKDNVVVVNGSTSRTVQTYSSDERIKTNINNLDNYEDFFYSLEPVCFNFRDDCGELHPEQKRIGFIAQKTIKNFSDSGIDWRTHNIVVQDDVKPIGNSKKYISDYMYLINYMQFIPLNTHMIQKQKKEIDELTKENHSLKERLMILENKVSMLLDKFSTFEEKENEDGTE